MSNLVTGCAGFIGSHLAKRLLDLGEEVIGVDNLNDYYDIRLKEERLSELLEYPNFHFEKVDISDHNDLEEVFESQNINNVFHLAAQAGVRYSISKPEEYMKSNVTGFFNVLSLMVKYNKKHLYYASSSSVYGNQKKIPYQESDCCNNQVSFYAATKKSNEIMAESFCCIHDLVCTGLRFFTVYGPKGRPDMAYYSFTDAIYNNKQIKIYNNGQLSRDFTYIDDVIDAILLLRKSRMTDSNVLDLHEIYNIGQGKPAKLMDFVLLLEKLIGKDAKKVFMPMQPGDVLTTFADTTKLFETTGVKPTTSLNDGLMKFVEWFKKYKEDN